MSELHRIGVPGRWLPVVGWEDRYLVSDEGQVWSLRSRRVLTLQRKRYDQVCLQRERRRWWVGVHLVVLAAFVGPRPDGQEACHGPAGRFVNTIANLRWDTHEANVADRVAHGSHRGERNGRAKLTRQDADDIRARRAAGERVGAIASFYGVHRNQVYNILAGRQWSCTR